MGWLIFLGISVVYLSGMRFFYRLAFRKHYLKWETKKKIEAYKYPSLYSSELKIEDYEAEREWANMDAIPLAIFWPVTWVFFVGSMLLGKVEPDTQSYRKLKYEKEIKELKALAREHGLELPENIL